MRWLRGRHYVAISQTARPTGSQVAMGDNSLGASINSTTIYGASPFTERKGLAPRLYAQTKVIIVGGKLVWVFSPP